MFQSPIRSARASSSVEKYSFRYGSAPPWRRSLKLAGAVADHLVHRGQQVLGLLAVLRAALRSPPATRRTPSSGLAGAGGAERVAAAEEQEVLRAVLLVNLVLVRQVVADRRDVEVAGLDQHFDRLHDRRLERLPLVRRGPRRRVLEVRRRSARA